MRILTTASFAAAAVLATATFSTPVAAGALFGSIVVFGTSLSDPGNAFALRGGTNTPPDYLLDPFLVPSVRVRARRPSFQQRRDAEYRKPY